MCSNHIDCAKCTATSELAICVLRLNHCGPSKCRQIGNGGRLDFQSSLRTHSRTAAFASGGRNDSRSVPARLAYACTFVRRGCGRHGNHVAPYIVVASCSHSPWGRLHPSLRTKQAHGGPSQNLRSLGGRLGSGHGWKQWKKGRLGKACHHQNRSEATRVRICVSH